MRFRTRAFLLCFVPVALLLMGSFWAIRKLVETTVQDNLRASLRDNQLSIARLRSRTDLQNSRFLRVVGENASLKAGLQLVRSNPANLAAKETLEDQLREMCAQMGFDYLAVSSPDGRVLAAVIRTDAGVASLAARPEHSPRSGLITQGDRVYRIASVPIDQAEENIGELSVGERFDLSEFNTPAVLLHEGKILQLSVPGIALPEMETVLKACRGQSECDVRLGGASYMSLPLQGVS